jgi:N-formylglutamate amidohydrolase
VTSTEVERRRDADLLVDALFRDAPSLGASLLVANWSRHVIDLNRSALDIDSGTVAGSTKPAHLRHGLIWRATGKGRALLTSPLAMEALHALLEAVHAPYHDALAQEIGRKKRIFGCAILLAAHSMPGTDARGAPRADVVPGTCGRTTASAPVVETVERIARDHGFHVRHDDPYRGGYTTQTYGKPSLGVSAIQVEISRRLYASEEDAQPHEQFERVRELANALVNGLGAIGNCR